ncbi:MAG TPA: class I SAM-dependent methyltransferase [bacterium]
MAEINRGYLDTIRGISTPDRPGGGARLRRALGRSLVALRVAGRVALLPVLLLYAALLVLALGAVARLRGRRSAPAGSLQERAAAHVGEFAAQYPLHLYPVLIKALELAFITGNLEGRVRPGSDAVVELAVGDGTLSARVFPATTGVVALDLNPYSLVQTRSCPHISRRVVADCLEPPVADGGADFLISNNLLHHVTDKGRTLANWSRLAPLALFNENTGHWASGWFRPYALRALGLSARAARAARAIEEHSLQALLPAAALDALVGASYAIEERESAFDERVFFLSAVCSTLLGCYGPPTPAPLKRILNGPLRLLAAPLTRAAARALLRHDAWCDRTRDVLVAWVVRSRTVPGGGPRGAVRLVCPDCRGGLAGSSCTKCGRVFEELDGMLFLLPERLRRQVTYVPDQRDALGREHL